MQSASPETPKNASSSKWANARTHNPYRAETAAYATQCGIFFQKLFAFLEKHGMFNLSFEKMISNKKSMIF